MSTTASRTGRCLCDKVQYKLEGPSATPLWNTVCHCTNCLRLGGSSHFASICPKEVRLNDISSLWRANKVPKQGFAITQGKDLIKTYSGETTDSGNALHRQFCSNCGTKLFALTPLAEHIVSIAAGSLDDFDQWRPVSAFACRPTR